MTEDNQIDIECENLKDKKLPLYALRLSRDIIIKRNSFFAAQFSVIFFCV